MAAVKLLVGGSSEGRSGAACGAAGAALEAGRTGRIGGRAGSVARIAGSLGRDGSLGGTAPGAVGAAPIVVDAAGIGRCGMLETRGGCAGALVAAGELLGETMCGSVRSSSSRSFTSEDTGGMVTKSRWRRGRNSR
jgi:hypothetical protein